MANHQSMFYEIKSDLLDLLTGNNSKLSYTEWFNIVKPKIHKHFEITEIDFFIYDIGRKLYLSLDYYESPEQEKTKNSFHLSMDFIEEASATSLKELGFPEMDEHIVFRDLEGKPLAIALFKSTEQWQEFSSTAFLEEFKVSVSAFILRVRKIGALMTREKKFRRLFNITELFNSTMESDVILDGILDAVIHFFPFAEIQLLVAHEEKQATQTYKLFDYINERPSAIEAFVSGEVTSEVLETSGVTLINAPIKGRQAIYGILKMKTPTEFYLSATQMNLVKMVTNTAGSALENASLFDQSQRLIKDLQLINETSRKLNSNMPFGEMISYLKQQLTTAFSPSEIAFIFTGENKQDQLYTSSEYFQSVNGQTYMNYTKSYLESGKSALFDANYSKTVHHTVDFEAVIGIPITNQEEVVGYVLLLQTDSYFFSFESFKLMQSLIRHSSLALSNSMLRDQLQELVDKDYLTKLYNRRYLDEITEKSIMNNESGVLVLFDIDDFKLINDTHGHDVGDEVLKQIGAYLSEVAIGKGIAARWGGEEFAVYLPATTEEFGRAFSKQIIEEIPVVTNPSVTVSIGLSAWVINQELLFMDLFKSTDTALYKAKSSGKNKVIIHRETSSTES